MARDLPPGRHDVGDGLWLRRFDDGTAVWEMDLTVNGAEEPMEIGPFPRVSVKAARREAARLRGAGAAGA